MKHFVLSVMLLTAGISQQQTASYGSADVESAKNTIQALLCCGGPTCLPGYPCGPGK